MALGEMAEAGGGRRSINSEINMVPMIDLMICCISFLILTAVWTAWGRMEADIQGQSTSHCGACGDKKLAELHVTVRDPSVFFLTWREGNTVLRSREVPRQVSETGARYPGLAQAVRSEWDARPGSIQGTSRPIAAVLHVDAQERYGEMAAVMDAVQSPRLNPENRRSEPAFYVRLAN